MEERSSKQTHKPHATSQPSLHYTYSEQPSLFSHTHSLTAQLAHTPVQWSEDVINADPFFGRSRVRFRVTPWVSNTIARDHLA